MQPDLANPIEILLIEDNLGDVRLIEEVFKDAEINNKIHVAHDGEKAIKILRQEDELVKSNRPDLIILDLNLPKMDGIEVLREIKGDESLKCIPVIILTTSIAEEDLIETYKHNANCYINKPFDFDHFIKVINNIKNFWLDTAKLPPRVN